MRIEDLRIGNLVYDTEGKVNTVCVETFVKFNYQIEPILLSENWLLKFGFECSEYFKRIDKFLIKKTYDGYILVGDKHSIGEEFYYVHQLQNIYFALRGEELTIQQL